MKSLATRSPLLLLFLIACFGSSDFDRAKALTQEGKFHSAIEYYLSFVKKNPDHTKAQEALLEVGSLQEKILQEHDQALTTYRTLVAHYPVNQNTIEGQYRLAQILKNKKNDYQIALTEFDKLIRAASTHEHAPKFQFEIAECYTQLHQYEQANIEYQTLIEKYPGYEKLDEVYFKKANNNYIAGSYEEALNDYAMIRDQFSTSKYRVEAIFGMGASYEEMDQFDQAKRYYSEIQAQHPTPEVVEIRLQGLEKRKQKKAL